MFRIWFTLGLLSAAYAATLFTCNMDSITLCGMTQTPNDNFDWTRQRLSTSSVSTGPTTDHTLDANATGYYIYIETSFPRANGEVAEVSTPVFSTTDSTCVSFWYNMYGATTGRLVVSYNDTFGFGTEIYSNTGNRGNRWTNAELSIPPLNYPFIVTFQGYVGTSFTGDMALDDISVFTGRCLSNVGTTPTPLNSFSCDFESANRCGFTEEHSDNFDWLWHSGSTSSINTGPTRDHTRGQSGQDSTGHYLYIETSLPTAAGDIARTDSPVLSTGSSKSCLSFFYNMKGATIGTLNVFLSQNGVLGSPVWSKSGEQSSDSKWQFAQISLSANMAAFKIVFEGVVGASFTGDIGIDDVNVKSGNCFSSNPLG